MKLSQGLTHTLYLTYHLWRDTLDLCLRGQEVEGGSGTSCDVVIPEYYVLCNDTNVDLIMGQVNYLIAIQGIRDQMSCF